MTAIIELFDTEEPLNNILSTTAIKPDLLVVLGDRQISKAKTQRPLLGYLRAMGLSANTQFVPCRTYDIAHIASTIESVLQQYGSENCIIDVLGGSDTLLLAAGCCCQNHPEVRVITLRDRTEQLVWLSGPDRQTEHPLTFDATVSELIALTGGESLRHGHIDRTAINEEMQALICQVFAVYQQYRSRWPQFVQYLQQIIQPRYLTEEKLTYCGPRQFWLGRKQISVDLEIMMALAEIGVVVDFYMNAANCTIRLASEQIAGYLCDVGSWLELYVYTMLLQSGFFHDVDINVVVSWDDDEDDTDIINELDVIAMDGIGQLFISCKTGTPDNAVLNEIETLTERFGTRYAVPVLVTPGNLEREAPGVFRRAMEMGIFVIDGDDLPREAFLQRLQTVRRRWNMA